VTRRFERLDTHDVRRFRSGEHLLDQYLRKHAAINARRGIGSTWVLVRSPDDPVEWPEVLGYFTLSMAELPSAVAKAVLGDDLPAYPVPVALIGRLARDERAKGAGIGEALIGEALHRILEASELVACTGVIVDAKNADLVHFYARYGFTPTAPDGYPRRCFLPLSVARAARSR
jgi:ribosomal protein S18 acetylase RimI-like enzyme